MRLIRQYFPSGLFLLLPLLLSCSRHHATSPNFQPVLRIIWEQALAMGTGYTVLELPDSGFVVAGACSTSSTSCSLILIRTNANGIPLWTIHPSGFASGGDPMMIQAADGGFILAGTQTNIHLSKVSATGTLLWTVLIVGAQENAKCCLQQTITGDLLIGGSTVEYGMGSTDMFLVKADPSGSAFWYRAYGGIHYDYGFGLQATSEGGAVLVGSSESFQINYSDVYLLKTTAPGDTLWSQVLGGLDDDGGYSVRLTSDGGYIIAGYTLSFSGSWADVLLAKLDSTGALLWQNTYGNNIWNYGYCVRETADGGFIVAGYSQAAYTQNTDMYLVKVDSEGTLLWDFVPGSGKAFGIQETQDGGYIVCGEREGQLMLLKLGY